MVRHKAQNVAAKPRTGDVQIFEDTDFKSMLLPQPILEGLKKCGYIKPSPIQRKALPLVRCGFDLIVQAKAGTGKTCVFTVAVLELVKPSLPHLQAVVLAPTREIALQITSVINAIGQSVEGLKTCCFIGGSPLSVDIEKVKSCHVAVAAPGRMKHLLEKGLLNPHHVRLFVLDEADKLVENIFVKDINAIFAQLPESKQVIACSATYTEELVEFLSRYMNEGQFISPYHTVNPTLLLGVRQFVSVIPHHVDRLALLKLKEKQLLYLLRSVSFNQCLVFSNLHTRAVSLCNLLRSHGWGVEWIAGRQCQKDRVSALTQLRDQRVRVLVTTDLTARGIDVENVNLVINLDIPMNHHTYLHRMGRAGRYGSHGLVITVVSDDQELTAFQKLMGKINQSINRVPQTLKNIDLWTMSDEKFEKIDGIIEKKDGSSTSEKSEGNTTSTAEKCSPESSDSEGYVKEYKGENIIEKCSPESSDSEGYVKEYKGENGVGQINGAVNSAEKISVTHVESQGVTAVRNSEMYKDIFAGNSAVTPDKADDSTSTDEKFSPDSSNSEESADEHVKEESVTSENSCVCNLYVADPSNIKVIAGPSLFALKKEEHWREVLPVIVNESKVPLNTPIALLDSKLIRVRFWDTTERCSGDINVDISCKEVINFDTKCEDKDFLSFQDIVSILENGVKDRDPFEIIPENSERKLLSYENIEEALESGIFELDGRILMKSNEIEQVLFKHNIIKERLESSLISFDSFDLVGWLAVDELHNIVKEIDIDKCEVFEFSLGTCLGGKHHIQVLSPSKGRSQEAHDYIDHITTLNVESFSLSMPFSLSDIAQQIAPVTPNSSDKSLKKKIDPNFKPDKNKVVKQTHKEKNVCGISHVNEKQNGTCSDAKNNSSLKNFKVPIVDSNNKKCTAKKDGENDSVNRRKKCNSLSARNEVSSQRKQSNCKRHNQTKCSYIESTADGSGKRKDDKMVHPDNVNTFLTATFPVKQEHQQSLDKNYDSGPYLDMACNFSKNDNITKNKSGSSGSEQQSQLVSAKLTYSQKSLREKPKIHYQCESKSLNKNKHTFEHTRKHRNSDDSYDSFDSVDYETTDLDKELHHKFFNENGIQRKHHLIKHQDLTNDGLKESYDSHEYHNFKFTKPKIPHSNHERSKPRDSRNKQCPKDLQCAHSSVESEDAFSHPKMLLKVSCNKEHKSKSKYRHEVKHKTLHDDTEESYKESCDSYNSIESENSKLREPNIKQCKQDKTKRIHHHEFRHRKVHNKSEDDYDSFESGGTNRHSFRTACSQHVSDDHNHLHGYESSDRSSHLSNYIDENPFEISHHSHRRTTRYSEEFDNHSFQRGEEQEDKFTQGQEFPHFDCHYTYGSYDQNQHESYQNSFPQYHDSSDLPERGSTQTIRGESLHEEWYSNWYLQVRQRAMHLAMKEYMNTMSTS